MSAVENPPPLIDLGDDFDVRPDTGVRRRVERQWGRGAQLAVPLIAGLFFISASASPAPSPLPVVARVPVGIQASVLVTGNVAIVVDIEDRHNQISEYALDGGGHQLWSSPLSVLASDVNVQVASGAVVVSENSLQVSGVHIEAFDVLTGVRLWESTDGLRGIDVNGDVILESAVSSPDPTTLMRRVNARTGETLWSATIASGCDTTFGDDPDTGMAMGIVEVCVPPSTPAGSGADRPTLRVLDFTTGVVRATRTLHLNSSEADFYLLPSERLPGPVLTVVADVVLVTYDSLPTAMVDAFGIGDLTPLWSGLPLASTTTLRQCGPQLCMEGTDGITLFDLHTGKPLPGPPPVDPRAPAPGGIVLVPVAPVHPSAGSFPISRVPDGVAITAPKATSGEIWVAVVRSNRAPGQSATRPIQPLHDIGPHACVQVGAYLVCSTSPEQLTFWRLPT